MAGIKYRFLQLFSKGQHMVKSEVWVDQVIARNSFHELVTSALELEESLKERSNARDILFAQQHRLASAQSGSQTDPTAAEKLRQVSANLNAARVSVSELEVLQLRLINHLLTPKFSPQLKTIATNVLYADDPQLPKLVKKISEQQKNPRPLPQRSVAPKPQAAPLRREPSRPPIAMSPRPPAAAPQPPARPNLFQRLRLRLTRRRPGK
ncbi:MAG: hypothetical protein V1777_00265 [Candidatus Micrarchaeota archaeon]